MRSIFSLDGKQWIFGDAFGVTRVELGKNAKLSKHSSKFSIPFGTASMSADGKLGFIQGCFEPGSHGRRGMLSFGLPGLGPRSQLANHYEAGLYTCKNAPKAVRYEGKALCIGGFDANTFSEERKVLLNSPLILNALEIGPQERIARPDFFRPRNLLRVLPDGRFIALSTASILYAGKLGSSAYEDEIFWEIPLKIHPTSALSLEMVGENVWLGVMDHASELARLAQIERTGAYELHEVPSLCEAAVTEKYIVYQPSSQELCRRSLKSGETQSFQIGHHNNHPHPEPPLECYNGASKPPDPTRLPGHIAAYDEHILFVPWHAESIIHVNQDLCFSRGLDTGPGVLRRLVLEIFARENQELSKLQLQVQLGEFGMKAKSKSSPMSTRLPNCPPTLSYYVVSGLIGNMTDKFQLNAGGWNWGTFGAIGGTDYVKSIADIHEMQGLLQWMIAADMIPIEADRRFEDLYSRALGIPHDPDSDGLPIEPAAERMLLRATLETIAGCGWTISEIPSAWASEAIESDWAIQALKGLRNWKRHHPYESIDMLSMMLVHHLDRQAHPILISLLRDYPTPFCYPHYSAASQCLVWLCHKHPDLKDPSIQAIQQINFPGQEWAHAQKVALQALARGARHLWSNG